MGKSGGEDRRNQGSDPGQNRRFFTRKIEIVKEISLK